VAGEGLARLRYKVLRAAVAQMIAVRVGDDGRLYRLPGIDVEIPGRALKTATSDDDERIGIGCHNETLRIVGLIWRIA
jgi:hypothetical protein